jgi:hypothetical protein
MSSGNAFPEKSRRNSPELIPVAVAIQAVPHRNPLALKTKISLALSVPHPIRIALRSKLSGYRALAIAAVEPNTARGERQHCRCREKQFEARFPRHHSTVMLRPLPGR